MLCDRSNTCQCQPLQCWRLLGLTSQIHLSWRVVALLREMLLHQRELQQLLHQHLPSGRGRLSRPVAERLRDSSRILLVAPQSSGVFAYNCQSMQEIRSARLYLTDMHVMLLQVARLIWYPCLGSATYCRMIRQAHCQLRSQHADTSFLACRTSSCRQMVRGQGADQPTPVRFELELAVPTQRQVDKHDVLRRHKVAY